METDTWQRPRLSLYPPAGTPQWHPEHRSPPASSTAGWAARGCPGGRRVRPAQPLGCTAALPALQLLLPAHGPAQLCQRSAVGGSEQSPAMSRDAPSAAGALGVVRGSAGAPRAVQSCSVLSCSAQLRCPCSASLPGTAAGQPRRGSWATIGHHAED